MNDKRQFRLFFYFMSVVLSVLLVAILLVGIVALVLWRLGVIIDAKHWGIALVLILMVSAGIGLVLSAFVWNTVLSHVTDLSRSFKSVAKGDFNIRISEESNIQEIREMARGFNSMVSELAGIETLRSDFVVNVSHEFKTPLAAIEGYATLLQNSALDREKQEEYIDKIIDNASRLSSLAGNILNLSKLENQELVTDKKKYMLDEQIRQTVLMMENLWNSKDISIDIDLPRVYFYGNEGLMHQVLYNLISNAIKFTPSGGEISVELSEEDGFVTIAVKDTGCGMSGTVQEHIFEKFIREILHGRPRAMASAFRL